MRSDHSVETGTSVREGSVKALEVSPSSRRPKGGVAWLVVLASVCALGAAACGSLNSGDDADTGPVDSGVDAATTVDAQADTSTGGKDATTGSDSPTGDTSAPDSAQPDATTSDAARLDAPTGDAPTGDAFSSDARTGDGPSGDAPASDGALVCLDGGDASGDTDGDGTPDCLDGCPTDPNKTMPGTCGCGVADIDSDGDGILDCLDGCPFDATKTAPGMCGCGHPDVDTDGDGVLDCFDGCPTNAARTTPGPCGCSFADNTPLCLVHRYSFKDGPAADAGATDAGTTVVSDSIGHADGTAVNVTLTGAGSVTLAGTTSQQYISLPSGIVSALGNNATFEAFITWTGVGGLWQRIFDFGANSGGAGMQGAGTAFLFVTPVGGPGVMLGSFVQGGVSEADSTGIFPIDNLIHEVALVLSTPAVDAGAPDGGGATMGLYVDGLLKATVPLVNPLSLLTDVNNWLGRSQFTADPGLSAIYYEFRMYSAARTAPQLVMSTALGHNVLPTQ